MARLLQLLFMAYNDNLITTFLRHSWIKPRDKNTFNALYKDNIKYIDFHTR